MSTAALLETTDLIESNALFNDTVKLQSRLNDEGYLYFRGIGPRARILELRRQIIDICGAAGWVDRKYPLMEARWSGVGPVHRERTDLHGCLQENAAPPAFQ